MTIQEFREYMSTGKPIDDGSPVHIMFHRLSQEALKITAEINGKYHTPDELFIEAVVGEGSPRVGRTISAILYRLWKKHNCG